jgi:hypothetical protein
MTFRLLMFGLLTLAAAGCQTSNPKKNLRQPVVQEFTPPPKIAKFTEPTKYPDEKRVIVTEHEKKNTMPSMAGMGGPGPGGGGANQAGTAAMASGGLPGQR